MEADLFSPAILFLQAAILVLALSGCGLLPVRATNTCRKADLIERCCMPAFPRDARRQTTPGAELLWEPIINQGLVRFLDSNPDATEADHDRRTDEVIASTVATGEAFFEAQPGMDATPCGLVLVTGRPQEIMSNASPTRSCPPRLR